METITKTRSDDVVLETNLKLILNYRSRGKDASKLEKRYIELLKRKNNK